MRKLFCIISLVFLLALVDCAALTETMNWEQYAFKAKQLEHQLGDYAIWPLDEKVELIQVLVSTGYINADENTAMILDEQAKRESREEMADRLMLELTGQKDLNEVCLNVITYAILGSSDTWTPEQRVWWQEIVLMYSDRTNYTNWYVMPQKNDLELDMAILIAKEAIIDAYGLSNNALDEALAVGNLYVTHERPNYKRWEIRFNFYKDSEYMWVDRRYTAIVDETGTIISDPDIGILSPQEMKRSSDSSPYEVSAKIETSILDVYQEFLDRYGPDHFRTWSIEAKASYSQEMRPLLKDALTSGEVKNYECKESNMDDWAIIASTYYEYGLPDEASIIQSDALSLAKQELLREYDIREADYKNIYTYYDVTTSNAPLWRFLFYPSGKQSTDIFYRVELNAHTGKLVSLQTFERQSPLMRTLEYDLKWY